MPPQIRVGADTKPLKRALLDLKRDFNDLGKSGGKVSLINEKDRKLFEGQLNEQIIDLNRQLDEGRKNFTALVKEAESLKKGSKEELDLRIKINQAYKDQQRISGELARTEKTRGGLGGAMESLQEGDFIGAAKKIAIGTAMYGAFKTIRSTGQFERGTEARTALTGLGIRDVATSTPAELATVGITAQELNQRQVQSGRILGRAGGSEAAVLRRQAFERGMGLEGGTMMGAAGALRASMGGRGAEQAQMKLQASILSNGIEDALGPYLDSATGLLASINENGLAQTNDLIQLFGALTAQGGRTPEQLARSFGIINQAMVGSSGEANAFFQAAFARRGIGGGGIGGTRMAVEQGLFGIDPERAKRTFSDQQMKYLKETGQLGGTELGGLTSRGGAVLDLIREKAGLRPGQTLGEVPGAGIAPLSDLVNQIFGTKGAEGFDLARMLEDVSLQKATPDEFKQKLKELQEGTPMLDKLDVINTTLAGSNEHLSRIVENTQELLGMEGVKGKNVLLKADIKGTQATLAAAQLVTGETAKGALPKENPEDVKKQFDDRQQTLKERIRQRKALEDNTAALVSGKNITQTVIIEGEAEPSTH